MNIYKYIINWGTNRLMIPGVGRVLSAGVDPLGDLCVWVICYPNMPEGENLVQAVFTGDKPPATRFVSTVLHNDLVYHVFSQN